MEGLGYVFMLSFGGIVSYLTYRHWGNCSMHKKHPSRSAKKNSLYKQLWGFLIVFTFPTFITGSVALFWNGDAPVAKAATMMLLTITVAGIGSHFRLMRRFQQEFPETQDSNEEHTKRLVA